MNAVDRGRLDSGRAWILFESRKKCPLADGSGPMKGRHLILGLEDESAEVNKEERVQLWAIADELAEKYAVYPGRWRIARNGADVCTRPTFHVHLIFPQAGEEIPKLVFRPANQ